VGFLELLVERVGDGQRRGATRTGVDDKDYQPPFRFTGKIEKLTIKLGPNQMLAADEKAKAEALANAND